MDSRSPSRDAYPRSRRPTCYRADLPQQLRARLATRGLSQARLSQHTSIDPSTLSKILNGKRRPNAAQLGALAYVLDLDLDQLLVLPPSPDVLAERDDLRAKLDEVARARASVEAELKRVEQELAAAKLRLEEVDARGSWTPKPKPGRRAANSTPTFELVDFPPPEFDEHRAAVDRKAKTIKVIGTAGVNLATEIYRWLA